MAIMEQPASVPPPGTVGATAEQPYWRHDFPIDRPQDDYVARRDFTKFMVLISGAFSVGQLWIALQSLVRRVRRQPPERRLADIDEVPVGGAMLFEYPIEREESPCVLVRLAAEQFVAFSNQCTHLMCPVIPEVAEGHFHCACHRGFFDIATGRPTAGPPRRPLPRVTLAIREGAVYATGVEVAAR
jgi:nitrite reductase/ring-hydroxylating ferredoxin subunit